MPAEHGVLYIDEAIAESVKSLRKERGLSQEVLASVMVELGAHWSRSTVADLEALRRPLTIAEALMLTQAFDCSVADILQSPISVGDHTIAVLTGDLRAVIVERFEVDANRMARRETEAYAAEALGVQPEEVVRLSLELWQRGLLEERERRVAEGQGARAAVTRVLLAELREEMS